MHSCSLTERYQGRWFLTVISLALPMSRSRLTTTPLAVSCIQLWLKIQSTQDQLSACPLLNIWADIATSVAYRMSFSSGTLVMSRTTGGVRCIEWNVPKGLAYNLISVKFVLKLDIFFQLWEEKVNRKWGYSVNAGELKTSIETTSLTCSYNLGSSHVA